MGAAKGGTNSQLWWATLRKNPPNDRSIANVLTAFSLERLRQQPQKARDRGFGG